MSCKPCEEKKKAIQAENEAKMEKAAVQKVLDSNPTKLAINCICGLTRIIPRHLKFGEEFVLTPCPKCATALRYRFEPDGVHEVIA